VPAYMHIQRRSNATLACQLRVESKHFDDTNIRVGGGCNISRVQINSAIGLDAGISAFHPSAMEPLLGSCQISRLAGWKQTKGM